MAAATVGHNVASTSANVLPPPPGSFTFRVGKLDAGMAILVGERANLVEFPAQLLGVGVKAGSIVDIHVSRNHEAEQKANEQFWNLQNSILQAFATDLPSEPVLKVRSLTQTIVTLEWEPVKLGSSRLISLDIYKNGVRLSAIPNPNKNTSTKMSGLEVDTDYTFHLVLKTTSGTFTSKTLNVHTHTWADTSGIRVCFGSVSDDKLLQNAKNALESMGAKWSEQLTIDTTHFCCTSPAAPGYNGPSPEYQKAVKVAVPVIQPQWVLACEREGKMMPISSFYLGVVVPASSSQRRPTITRMPSISLHDQQEASAKKDAPLPEPPSQEVNQQGSEPIPSPKSATHDTEAIKNPESEHKHQQAKEEANDASDDHEVSAHPVEPEQDHSPQAGHDMIREFKFPSPVSSPVLSAFPQQSFFQQMPTELKPTTVHQQEEYEEADDMSEAGYTTDGGYEDAESHISESPRASIEHPERDTVATADDDDDDDRGTVRAESPPQDHSDWPAASPEHEQETPITSSVPQELLTSPGWSQVSQERAQGQDVEQKTNSPPHQGEQMVESEVKHEPEVEAQAETQMEVNSEVAETEKSLRKVSLIASAAAISPSPKAAENSPVEPDPTHANFSSDSETEDVPL